MPRALIAFALLLFSPNFLPAQTPTAASLLVKATPGTIVWVDHLRYGSVPESGELTIKNLPVGVRLLRARLLGKRELTQTVRLKPASQNRTQLLFQLPASAAEHRFQEAENLREKGQHKDAIALYQDALKLNKNSQPRARIGLARSLMATGEYEAAINEARRAIREAAAQPALAAEATTVMANTYRAQGLYDDAFENYQQALTLVRNISPEAHTGLALTWQEENNSAESIKHLRLALAQANDTEPIIYYLLGNLLDRADQIKEAMTMYEKFLLLDPNSKFAVTTRSMLKQLQREVR